jgi:hypothetical protein
MPPKARQQSSTSKPFPCPFVRCGRTYAKKKQLHDHVGGFMLHKDEAHPADDPAWPIVTAPGWMKIATRPGLLPDEAERRKRETRKRGYQDKREERLAKSQANRDELRSVADAGTQLGDVAAPLVSAAKAWAAAKAWQEGMPPFEKIAPPDAAPSIDIFLCILTYLLPMNQWPQPVFDTASPPTFTEVLPTGSHYKALSLLCHPDKRPDLPSHAQQMLNDSWDGMKAVLEAWTAVETELRASGKPESEWRVPVPDQSGTFQNLSVAHQNIYGVFALWAQRYREDMGWYLCQTVSIYDLRKSQIDEAAVNDAAGALDKVTEGKRKLAARDQRRPKRKTPHGD